jgi:hypothetical protein
MLCAHDECHDNSNHAQRARKDPRRAGWFTGISNHTAILTKSASESCFHLAHHARAMNLQSDFVDAKMRGSLLFEQAVHH